MSEIPTWMNIVRRRLNIKFNTVGGAWYLSNNRLRKTLSLAQHLLAPLFQAIPQHLVT